MPDKAEWKLEGQMLTITLGLTETVNSIKSKIMEEIGMPQGKQKLQHESIFLKVLNIFTKMVIKKYISNETKRVYAEEP